MAFRLLVRRVCVVCVRDLQRVPASVSSFSSRVGSSPPLFSRPLPQLSSRRSVSFNVQDHEDFTDRVINSQLPVLVDFHAQWCGPCKILGPRLEKAIAKQKGRVAMAKVDIDEHTDLAIEYGVSAVPTVIAMRGGDVIDQFVGIKDEDQLDSFVEKLIGQ
ncbi:thioredoxin, mitochondrial [Pseudorasbora parva]|uniref:thioredoxin, mitochondrial n=1 Tax=Pseudorasbora parva TaxID=51549 RepID=UPI00351EC44A